MGLSVNQGLWALLEALAPLDLSEHQGCRVLLEPPEQLEILVPQVLTDNPDHQDHVDKAVLQEVQDPLVQLDPLVKLVLTVTTVNQVK